jgi:hypothetical protein
MVWEYPLFALIRTRSPLWIAVSFIGGVFFSRPPARRGR